MEKYFGRQHALKLCLERVVLNTNWEVLKKKLGLHTLKNTLHCV